MKKPAEMSTWTTAVALSRISNSLPLFPGGEEASKFTPAEMLEILDKLSLPPQGEEKAVAVESHSA